MKFLRRKTQAHSKFGKRRKKVQKWRRPSGRDNKMREKRRGYPKVVSIGYKKSSEKSLDKSLKIIMNLNDLNKIAKNEVVIIGKVGKKKKIEIAKKMNEMKIKVQNLNIGKFLRGVKNESKK